MENRLTTLEKAFDLARSGKCLNFGDIVKRLKSEKYDINQLSGPALKNQLVELVKAAR